jgi:Flp pilus assembly pilin Flp
MHVSIPLIAWVRALVARVHRRADGQATAEYALVLLGAAAVALALAAWAAKSGAIGELFDTVAEQLIGDAG